MRTVPVYRHHTCIVLFYTCFGESIEKLLGTSTDSLACLDVLPLQVRELLVNKLENSISKLKILLCKIPKMKMASVAANYVEIEKKLQIKCSTIEEVDEQRKYIAQLPNIVGSILEDIELTKVHLTA